jgi:putative alpha-1,2-mannosidase
MISPVNKTGENPEYKSSVYYDDFYCGWDIWHGVMPMLTLLQPDATSGMVQTLIDIATYIGWMPDCRMSTQGWTQGGSNADNILGDFLLKLGQSYGGIDWKKGWNALMKDVYEVSAETVACTTELSLNVAVVPIATTWRHVATRRSWGCPILQ